MDSSESVHFDFADGTSVAVESSDYRRVYDELWTLSKVPRQRAGVMPRPFASV